MSRWWGLLFGSSSRRRIHRAESARRPPMAGLLGLLVVQSPPLSSSPFRPVAKEYARGRSCPSACMIHVCLRGGNSAFLWLSSGSACGWDRS